MKKFKVYIITFIIFIFPNLVKAKVEIKYKIGEQIITNIDILNEKNYLLFLNNNLKNLKSKDVEKIAKSSLIREIIKKNEIKIVKTNRGGKTTYHGPGQRIVYFMIDLNSKQKDIRKFITIIEQSLIDFLSIYNINATTFKDRVGIWVTGKDGKKFDKEEKIGAIGLRLQKWITYHGLSFNIKPDMKKYEYINACGLENFKNTSLYELGIEIDEKSFDAKYSIIFLKNLKKLI